jgi:small conductance mechanosensitive channel
MIAIPPLAIPTTLPNVAAMPGDVRQALPALTVMLVNGGINILIAIAILVGGWAVARWLSRWVQRILSRSIHIDETLKPLVVNFVRYAVLAVTLVAVLSQFGVQTTSLIALLGATGLAIGLALQGTLSNVAAGVMLLFLRPFRVTETIIVNGVTGTVHEIGLFQTELITDDGLYVVLPNSMLFSGMITNTSRQPTRRVKFSVDIDRDANIKATCAAILEAVTRDGRVMKTPAPQVVIDDLDGPKVVLTLLAWVPNPLFGTVQSDLRLVVRETLAKADVSPPVPVPAPAVAPWQPPVEKDDGKRDTAKPN